MWIMLFRKEMYTQIVWEVLLPYQEKNKMHLLWLYQVKQEDTFDNVLMYKTNICC